MFVTSTNHKKLLKKAVTSPVEIRSAGGARRKSAIISFTKFKKARQMGYYNCGIFKTLVTATIVPFQEVVHFPLKSRLESLMRCEAFAHQINYEIWRPQGKDGIVADVYDCAQWKARYETAPSRSDQSPVKHHQIVILL